jgi:hypothetical protein
MGFSSWRALRAALDAGQHETEFWQRSSVIASVPNDGGFFATWYTTGTPGGGSAAAEPSPAPGGSVYVNHPAGINFADAASLKKYLAEVHLHGSMPSSGGSLPSVISLLIYDRLVAVGGISSAVGTYTINTSALPRYTDGLGVWAMLEHPSGTGPNGLQWRLASYTNHLGVTGKVGPTRAPTSYNNGTFFFSTPIAAGDLGVRSVEQLEIVATGNAASTVSLVLIKPITVVAMRGLGPSPNPQVIDMLNDAASFSRVYDGATLCLAFQAVANFGNVASFSSRMALTAVRG